MFELNELFRNNNIKLSELYHPGDDVRLEVEYSEFFKQDFIYTYLFKYCKYYIRKGFLFKYLQKRKKNIQKIEFDDVESFLKTVFYFNEYGLKLHRFKDDSNSNLNTVLSEDFQFDLFIWAILLDRIELAELFWKNGQVGTMAINFL